MEVQEGFEELQLEVNEIESSESKSETRRDSEWMPQDEEKGEQNEGGVMVIGFWFVDIKPANCLKNPTPLTTFHSPRLSNATPKAQ
jgi:hypothetical protein